MVGGVVCGVVCGVVVWWCGVWCVVCGVWCVVCGVWCVVCVVVGLCGCVDPKSACMYVCNFVFHRSHSSLLLVCSFVWFV